MGAKKQRRKFQNVFNFKELSEYPDDLLLKNKYLLTYKFPVLYSYFRKNMKQSILYIFERNKSKALNHVIEYTLALLYFEKYGKAKEFLERGKYSDKYEIKRLKFIMILSELKKMSCENMKYIKTVEIAVDLLKERFDANVFESVIRICTNKCFKCKEECISRKETKECKNFINFPLYKKGIELLKFTEEIKYVKNLNLEDIDTIYKYFKRNEIKELLYIKTLMKEKSSLKGFSQENLNDEDVVNILERQYCSGLYRILKHRKIDTELTTITRKRQISPSLPLFHFKGKEILNEPKIKITQKYNAIPDVKKSHNL